jgi:hypothetical protein
MQKPRGCRNVKDVGKSRICRRDLIERFEDGQVRLRSSQPFRAPSASDIAQISQTVQERFDECRLADARLADDAEDAAVPAARVFEQFAQSIQLRVSSHDRLSPLAVQRVLWRASWQIASRCGQAIDALDGGGKAVANARDRDDEMLAIVAERSAQERDVARQAGVLDETVGPHRLQQVFLSTSPACCTSSSGITSTFGASATTVPSR